jgi:hypothetical protein
MQRLGVRVESWVDCVPNFGRWFQRAAGRVTHLAGEAARTGRQWFSAARIAWYNAKGCGLA